MYIHLVGILIRLYDFLEDEQYPRIGFIFCDQARKSFLEAEAGRLASSPSPPKIKHVAIAMRSKSGYRAIVCGGSVSS